MEITRAEKLRLGVFVLVALVLALGLIGFLIGKKLWETQVEYYTVFEESVDGLNAGATVKVNGVNVGQVTRLKVNPENLAEVLVYFQVPEGTPIKPGMRANLIGGMSITGLKSIQLAGGSKEAANLEPGSEIPAGTSQMKQLTGQAESIALKFETVLNNLASLTGDQNQASIQDLLASLSRTSMNIDTLTNQTRGVMAAVPKDFRKGLNSLEAAANELKLLSEDLRKAQAGKEVKKALQSFSRAAKNLDTKVQTMPLRESTEAIMSAARSLESTSKRADLTLYKIQENLNASMRNMRETMENMNEFSRQIKENPSLLLRAEDKKGRER